MVADNEFAGSILRARKGFSVGAESLAVDVIEAAMASTHNFLGQKHTVEFLKSGEVYLTRLAERSSWDNWERGNRQGLAERAQAELVRILREHQVQPLDAAQERELDTILAAAEKELVK